jgi:hypothetical protein
MAGDVAPPDIRLHPRAALSAFLRPNCIPRRSSGFCFFGGFDVSF